MENPSLSLEQELQKSLEVSSNFRLFETEESLKKKIGIKLHKDKIDERNTLEDNKETKYPYYDSKGKLKYEITRITKADNEKIFSVESIDENGKKVKGLNGTEKIPYNVPELLNACDDVVYIVNGENKVDELKKFGLIATTAPFLSSKKWDKKFNKYLSQAGFIIILADNKQDSKYIKYLDNTLETVRKDYPNVARIEISDYLDYFNLDTDSVKTINDLIRLLPKEQIIDFFNSINNKIQELIEV